MGLRRAPYIIGLIETSRLHLLSRDALSLFLSLARSRRRVGALLCNPFPFAPRRRRRVL
jgi:hypothetical protein